MKNILIITLVCFFISLHSFSQGNWTQKTAFAGTARSGATSFSIGNKFYFGLGNDGLYKQDFWEWDQSSNTWTQKANFGGIARTYAVGFSIGTKGYVGTGNQAATYLTDFWEWDQTANTWTQKGNCGGTVRSQAVGFSIGTKGYIGTGTNNVTYLNDFWEWNQTTNTWTQKANVGGLARSAAVGFSIGTKGFIGLGNNTDFWEWDQATNTWIQKNNFPGTYRFAAIGFAIGSKGYVGTGTNSTTQFNDFWEFDPTLNSWTQEASFVTGRSFASGVSIGTKGYLCAGWDGTNKFKDLYEFDPGTGCTSISISSQPSNQNVTTGSGAIFNVSASGTSPYTYQWQVSTNSGGNWSNLSNSGNTTWTAGGSSSTLTVSNTSTGQNNYQYRCVVSNSCPSSENSGAGILTVSSGCISISITSNPSNQTVITSNAATFSVSASGTTPYTYQWQVSTNGGSSWSNLSNNGNTTWTTGGSSSTLTITNTSTGQNNYQYRCVVNNSCPSSATSGSGTLTINPVTYWIGGYTRPENNPNFPNEKFLMSATTYTPATAALKVCADGSKATIIKLNCDNPNLNMQNIRFRISSDPTNSNPNLYGEFNSSNYYSNPSLAQVRFTHPNYLASGLHRLDSIQAYDINSPNIILISIPIKVCRASILFVHGLWGGYSSFQEMDNYFINYFTNSNIVTFRADYSANNGAAKSFNYNTYTAKVLPTNIYNTLNKAIGLNFSAGKVDVISHSMGGDLTRLYMQSSMYNYDIHTLTTINTPHSGTQAANLLRSSFGRPIYPLMLLAGNCVTCGAVADLEYSSTYFSTNLNGNSKKVPSLVYTSDSYSFYNPINWDWFAMDYIYAVNGSFFVTHGMITSLAMTQQLYKPDISDVIVPLESQRGGVSTFTHYNQVTHTNAEKNATLFPDLNNKIGHNPLSSFYNNNGFQHANLSMPWWFYFPPVIPLTPLLTSIDTISIFTPADSLTFNVGDTIPFHISRLNGNISYLGCMLNNQGQSIYNNSISDSVLNFQYIIPSTVYGTVKALAYGLNGSGGFDYDSIYFFVNINATLDSMQIQTDSMLIPIGNFDNINVDGFYSDTITRTLSTLQGMNYTILDTSIVSLTGTNTLFAKQIGITQVIANYQGLNDTAFVTVFQGQNTNNASFSVSNSIVCGSGDIQFLDQSDGTPISWEWQFPGGTPSTSTDQYPLVNYSNYGTYDVTLITTWSTGTDTLFIPTYIIVDSIPSATINPSGSTSFCQGQSVLLAANSGAGFSYFWSNRDTTQNITVADSGEYSVTVIDSLGCNATSSTETITVFTNPIPTITGNTAICQNDSTTLDAGSGYTNYLWSTSETAQTITVTTAGIYSVTVTDVNGCSNSTSLNITVNSADTSVTANGFILTANTSSATYQWIFCDSVLISGEINQTFVALQNGSYAVIVSQNGCTDTSSCYLIVGMGISQINNENNISIYPNPTNGLLNIKVFGLSNENCKLILTNTLGQIINEKEFKATNNSTETQFDMKGLSDGIYFLTLTSDKIKETFKVHKR